MDSRVPATIALHLAKAELKVSELERLEAETPSLSGNSDLRLRIARRLRVARDLAESWRTALTSVEYEVKMGAEEQDALDKEFKAAPDRIVAQVAYVANDRNRVYCNRPLCYSTARKGESLVPLAPDDLPDGGICSVCGTDVLA